MKRLETLEMTPRRYRSGLADNWQYIKDMDLTYGWEKKTGPFGAAAADRVPEEDVIFPTVPALVLSRVVYAAGCLASAIDIDSDVRGGVPVLHQTRFPVARVFAELAENVTIQALADEYDLDIGTLENVLRGIAAYLDRPLARNF